MFLVMPNASPPSFHLISKQNITKEIKHFHPYTLKAKHFPRIICCCTCTPTKNIENKSCCVLYPILCVCLCALVTKRAFVKYYFIIFCYCFFPPSSVSRECCSRINVYGMQQLNRVLPGHWGIFVGLTLLYIYKKKFCFNNNFQCKRENKLLVK